MGDRITYVGLDVHKDGIVVAVAEDGLRGEVRDYGRIANTPAALRRLVGKLGGEGVRLRFCYEAGPSGYGIQRQLAAAGHDCVVVAPSLIPRAGAWPALCAGSMARGISSFSLPRGARRRLFSMS
jgi:transposase